jgi:regulator of sigma E protease
VKPKFDLESQRRLIGVLLCWNLISQVDEGSPAYEAGIRVGDTVLSINGQGVYNETNMSGVLRSIGEGEKTDVVVLRSGNVTEASLINVAYETLPGVQLRWVDGIHIEQERLPVWRAIYSGARYIVYMPVLIVEAIPQMIKSPDTALVGPIGAGQLTVEVVRSSGSSSLLFMASMISLGIGIFNLFPIPPLDGGGMLVAFIEGCRGGRRLSPRTVRLAHYVGTAFLIALIVAIFIVDIWRLPKGFGL